MASRMWEEDVLGGPHGAVCWSSLYKFNFVFCTTLYFAFCFVLVIGVST